jgi:hypothetical protein
VVLFFPCTFGVKLPLLLGERFGQRVEVEGLEFINAIPIEWRLVSNTDPVTGWQESIPERKCFAFHDLQRPNRSGGTRGTPGAGVWLEMRGIGDGTLVVWLRDGTFQVSPIVRSELVMPSRIVDMNHHSPRSNALIGRQRKGRQQNGISYTEQ